MLRLAVILLMTMASVAYAQETAVEAPVEVSKEVEQKEQTAPLVEPSSPEPVKKLPPPEVAVVKAEPRPFKLGLSLYYSFADKIDGEGMIHVPGGSFTFSGQEGTEAVPGIAISMIKHDDPGWGLEFGIAHEFERKIESYSLTVNGATTSGVYTEKGSLSLLSFFLNFRVYATPETYFLGGANVTKVALKDSDISLDTGYGGQVGLGYQFSPQIGLEALYRLIMVKGRASGVIDGDAVNIDYDDLELNGLMVALKFQF